MALTQFGPESQSCRGVENPNIFGGGRKYIEADIIEKGTVPLLIGLKTIKELFRTIDISRGIGITHHSKFVKFSPGRAFVVKLVRNSTWKQVENIDFILKAEIINY